MTEDQLWKRRFLAYSAVRLTGLALFFLGIAIAYGNLLRPGGWPQLGATIAIAGTLWALLMPRQLKKRWDAERHEARQ